MDETAEIMSVENDCPLKARFINCSKLSTCSCLTHFSSVVQIWFMVVLGCRLVRCRFNIKARVCPHLTTSFVRSPEVFHKHSSRNSRYTTISFVSVFCAMIGYFTKSYSAFPVTQCCTIVTLISALPETELPIECRTRVREGHRAAQGSQKLFQQVWEKFFFYLILHFCDFDALDTRGLIQSICVKRLTLCEQYLYVMS